MLLLSIFETLANQLRPQRKRILVSAILIFSSLVALILLGGPGPKSLYFVLVLAGWWLWLALMLVAFYDSLTISTDDLAGLVNSFPGSRQFFLFVLVLMAIAPVFLMLLHILRSQL